MRSFLGFLVFIAALVAVLAAFALPAVVSPLVVSAVRSASPFGDQPLDVEVDVDAIGLIRGFVREIRISGEDLERDGVVVGSLDLAIQGVSIGDQGFAGLAGGLDAVDVGLPEGTSIRVGSVELSGPSTAVHARATLEAPEAEALILAAFADAGLELDGLQLVEGGVAVDVFGTRAEVGLAVANGAIVAPSLLGLASVPVLQPQPGDAWRVVGLSVEPGGLEIDATVDAGRLMATD
jgi:hypothetical protein